MHKIFSAMKDKLCWERFNDENTGENHLKTGTRVVIYYPGTRFQNGYPGTRVVLPSLEIIFANQVS